MKKGHNFVLQLLSHHHHCRYHHYCPLPPLGFPGDSDGEESVCNAEDPGSRPGSGRSPGEGNGNLLQDSCLENPMDRRAWQATVPGVAQSQTRLSDEQFQVFTSTATIMGFPGGSAGKGSSCNAGDLGLIPGLGRSPGGGNGYPL